MSDQEARFTTKREWLTKKSENFARDSIGSLLPCCLWCGMWWIGSRAKGTTIRPFGGWSDSA